VTYDGGSLRVRRSTMQRLGLSLPYAYHACAECESATIVYRTHQMNTLNLLSICGAFLDYNGEQIGKTRLSAMLTYGMENPAAH
jgi:hypothetical protein